MLIDKMITVSIRATAYCKVFLCAIPLYAKAEV